MNITRYEFYPDDLTLGIYEKLLVGFVWFQVVFVGNTLLYGLIQFDRLGGDPLKHTSTPNFFRGG